MTIGELLQKLDQFDKEAACYFGFGNFVPTTIDSWRGLYEQAAIGYESPGGMYAGSHAVKDVIDRVKEGFGGPHAGWKGGEYYFDGDTELWVDNPGEYSCVKIHDVVTDGCFVFITTRHESEVTDE